MGFYAWPVSTPGLSGFAEGRRRALLMALAGALFCGACLLVEVAEASRAAAYAILVTAVIAVAAAVALAAAVSMLRLERRLPEATRLTPRPRR
jgi:hypothetical protein